MFHLNQIFFFIIINILCFHFQVLQSDPRATEAALVCTNRTASPSDRQIFVANFLASINSLTPLISTQRYANSVNGTSRNTTVYSFGECMKDLSQTDCDLCFAQCKTQILRCLPFQRLVRGGRLFFDGCYLRYDDYEFFRESLSVQDKIVCGSRRFSGDLGSIVGDLVRNLSVEAPRNDGFFVGFERGMVNNVSIYGLAQCWEFVDRSGCEECLSKAASDIASCFENDEGRVLNSGCYLRYSTQKFYNNSTAVMVANRGSSRLAVILASTSSAVAGLMILATAAFLVNKRVLKTRRERKQLGALLGTVNKSKLNYAYETLERATNYFDNSNKLGQGGSGSVYKGTLADGKVIAIKRLFFNTRQWVDHFFNEVNLISDVDHKNLVKLLGCSVTGPESLLVYEYVPNHSLQDYLFGSENNDGLTWEVRYNIILGTAEGLAYLHEESKLRIIHRDIKLSNILLDENLMAKIADFGLARLFPEDKTHISTAIAGTLGYMAPEYVIRGKLTEKADVYSFGVLLIEVVSGRRINFFSQNSTSILETVWSLYGSDKLYEAVDPVLEGNFEEEQASRVLKIGLLCVQASADLRPSMSVVVKMLNNCHEIPQPAQPPYLNSTSMEMKSFVAIQTYDSQPGSHSQSSGNNLTQSIIEPR